MINGFSASMPRQFSGEKIVFSTNDAGQLDIHLQKNEVGFLLYTIYKYSLKMDQNLNVRAKIIQNS